jgi:hypothetical protein
MYLFYRMDTKKINISETSKFILKNSGFSPNSESINPSEQIREVIKKPKKKRVFVENLDILEESDYNPETQWNIFVVKNQNADSNEHDIFIQTIIKRHVSTKIQSYKSQDQKNKIWDPENFVNLDFVMELLKKSEMKCFYCKEHVLLLYKHVREPKQWTLERIDNKIGHNKGNIEIACLSCNLRRRCMYHERFVFTKQMKIVKTT